MTPASQSSALALLRQAQTLDKEIYDLTQLVEDIPVELKAMAASFAEQGRMLDALTQEWKAIQLKHRELENDLSTRDGNVRKYEAQLVQVKTNKEYAALQQEIHSLKADISIAEEKIIAVLDDLDAQQKKVALEKERLKKEEDELGRKKNEKEAERAQALARIQVLTAERKDILSKVDPSVRSQYEVILRNRHGIAMSPLQGENCGVCQILIRPQLENEVRLNDKIVTCENCGRILYVE